MKKIGLIINPIAGMGGRVGLKGTDGENIIEKAIELGSKKESGIKAQRALEELKDVKDDFIIYLASGEMGEDVVDKLGYKYEVIYNPGKKTSRDDTLKLAQKLFEEKVDLIVFVGGDGTARDIFSAVETKIPAVGVPAGVKIHSPVYGKTPELTGRLVRDFIDGKELDYRDEEVVDLDEEAFRNDKVEVRLFGYLKVPFDQTYLQNQKSPTPQSDEKAQESIALEIIDSMEDDVYYIIGSGTTPMHILEELGLDYTILGVDIVQNKKLVAKDVNEKEIIDIIKGKRAKLIVTPMGGQGYVFGRGNQQLSQNVLRLLEKDDITIIATEGKLKGLGDNDLLIYTLDDEVDKKLSGYYRVVIGYGRYLVHRASNGRD